MGDAELAEEQARTAVAALTEAVQGGFRDPVLARLWAAAQIGRAIDKIIKELLVDARRSHLEGVGDVHTWEEIGAVLGISAQGARQKMLRRREPVNLHNEPPRSTDG